MSDQRTAKTLVERLREEESRQLQRDGEEDSCDRAELAGDAAIWIEAARELLRKCVTTGYSRHEINCFLAGQTPRAADETPACHCLEPMPVPFNRNWCHRCGYEITGRAAETTDAAVRDADALMGAMLGGLSETTDAHTSMDYGGGPFNEAGIEGPAVKTEVPQLCTHDDGSWCNEECREKERKWRAYHGILPKR